MPPEQAETAASIAARRAGVRDPRVLDALRAVPRHRFVRAADRRHVDEDRPLRIGHDQTTSQPSLIAAMVERLELTGAERVLEVGTGLGYQAAILAQLAAQVVTIERVGHLAVRARENLAATGIDNVEVVWADGSAGAPDLAPFDAAILAAAAPVVPPELIEQLRGGGRLVAPVEGPSGEEAVVFVKRDDGFERVERIAGVRFVPLITDGPHDAGGRSAGSGSTPT
ncbi:MAG: protein-L-isoaspartate(D-aspartate) O-methyltransferase [Nitriliruptoraceae bacterium]|nr:protein-L-isoaspartate(D-aspartate) O-methyltransferase [Nitriliruptoraceae bacterium]